MSATGRTPGLREPDDAYPTERYCVDRLLDRVKFPGGRWMEPFAGEGDVIRAVMARRSDVVCDAVEIRRRCEPFLRAVADRVTIGDFFRRPHQLEQYSVCPTNPPYHRQLPERALESLLLWRHLWIALLLPLGWLSSARRQPLIQAVPPDVYVLPNRPIFRGSHGDQVDYAWMVWPPRARRPRSHGLVQVLDVTPRLVRIVQRSERREWARSVGAPSALPKRVRATFGKAASLGG